MSGRVIKAQFDGPNPELDRELALAALDVLTVGDAKLRQRRIGQRNCVLITGRPWIVLPHFQKSPSGFCLGWLLWMLAVAERKNP